MNRKQQLLWGHLERGNHSAAVKSIAKMSKEDLNNAPNFFGDPGYLPFAVRGAPIGVVKALIDAGADVNAKGGGKTCHTLALKARRQDIADLLVAAGAKKRRQSATNMSPEQMTLALYKAAGNVVDDDKLIALLRQGADPNRSFKGGMSAWLRAAQVHANTPAVIKALLKAGADVEATDAKGNTALHLLSREASWPATIRVLLKAGLDINVANEAGQTALHLAARADYWNKGEFVKALLSAGADHRLTDRRGKTAYDTATGTGKELLFPLMQTGTTKNDLALFAAVIKGDSSAVKRALAKGADPCAVLAKPLRVGPEIFVGTSALHQAMMHGRDAGLRRHLLALPQLDANVRDAEGATPLHHVLRISAPDRRETVRQLINHGADINVKDHRHGAPCFFKLVSAYEYSDEWDLLDELVAGGAKLKLQDSRGHNLLEAEVCDLSFRQLNDPRGWLRMVRHLLDAYRIPVKEAPRGGPFLPWFERHEARLFRGKKATIKASRSRKAPPQEKAARESAKGSAAKPKAKSRRTKARASKSTHLVFSQGSSKKFWEIALSGNGHVVRYGRIGSAGQRRKKSFDSAAAARSDAEKLIKQKRAKGYVEG